MLQKQEEKNPPKKKNKVEVSFSNELRRVIHATPTYNLSLCPIALKYKNEESATGITKYKLHNTFSLLIRFLIRKNKSHRAYNFIKLFMNLFSGSIHFFGRF